MIERVLLAGGERAGQVLQGVALAQELRRRFPTLQVLFASGEDAASAALLARQRERVVAIDAKPWAKAGVSELARGVVNIPRNALQGWSVVRNARPDLVIGLGGVVSRSVLAAATALRVPTVLLDRKPSAGLANRLLDRSAGRVYVSDPITAPAVATDGARALGQPVRRGIVDAARVAALDPAGVEARSRTVLVLGGVRGAAALNTCVPDALAEAGLASLGLQIVHQSGSSMLAAVARSYRERGIRADVVPFVDDVGKAYLNAALVIARAGSSTMAEVCAIGRPAILVPDSCAGSDLRARRAGELHRAGAALSLPAPNLDVMGLATHIRALLGDRARRATMAEASRCLGQPEAAAAIVDDVLAWLGVASPRIEEPVASADEEPVAEAQVAVGNGVRRPKVRRAELRVRPVTAAVQSVRGALPS